MDHTSVPFNPLNLAHLNAFRLIVAGSFRDLLAACKQGSPETFDSNYEKISNKGLKTSNATPLRLLVNASRSLKRIPIEFGGYQDSVPYSEPEERLGIEGAFLQIRDMVLECADPDELQQAVRNLQGWRHVEWETLIDWSVIPRLRRRLDELPDARKGVPVAVAERIWELATKIPKSLEFHKQRPGEPGNQTSETTLTNQSYALIGHLLDLPGHSAAVSDLAIAVWKDREKHVEGSPLNSELRRVRAPFRELNAPFEIKVSNHFVILSRSPTKPLDKKAKTKSVASKRRNTSKARRRRAK